MATEAKNAAIEDMFKAGVHFGYSRSSRHPNSKEFIFGIRNNVEVFDLEKVSEKLSKALDFIKELGKNKKAVLFVSTKVEATEPIMNAAKETGMPFVTERWLGGTLTNFKMIRKRIEYMEDLSSKLESGELDDKYTKKERLLMEKDFIKLNRYLGGLKLMKNIPSAIVVIDPCEEKIVIDEAKVISIPAVAVVNSDCDPTMVEYPIPGNDNSLSSIQYFLDEIVKAYKEGLKESAADESEKSEQSEKAVESA